VTTNRDDHVITWLLVTASREWCNPDAMRRALQAIKARHPTARIGIVHGGARGGDTTADHIARELGWDVDPVPCTSEEWERYGKSAGHRRNKRMVQRHAYLGCVAFPIGLSAGTRGCMVLAEDAGIKVWNRGEPPLPDGSYRVTDVIHGKPACAAFVVRRGLVVDCAPILRRDLKKWWRLAADPGCGIVTTAA